MTNYNGGKLGPFHHDEQIISDNLEILLHIERRICIQHRGFSSIGFRGSPPASGSRELCDLYFPSSADHSEYSFLEFQFYRKLKEK